MAAWGEVMTDGHDAGAPAAAHYSLHRACGRRLEVIAYLQLVRPCAEIVEAQAVLRLAIQSVGLGQAAHVRVKGDAGSVLCQWRQGR